MSDITQCFTVAELAQLSEEQLNLLRLELERQVRESPELQNILRTKMEPLRLEMLEQNAATEAAEKKRSGA